MESEIIFNKIIKTLTIINPEINVVTIHDSIIVPKQHKELVENVFNSIIGKEFSFIDINYSF